MDGGLVTFQIGPRSYWKSDWFGSEMLPAVREEGHEYIVGVLGEVDDRKERLIASDGARPGLARRELARRARG